MGKKSQTWEQVRQQRQDDLNRMIRSAALSITPTGSIDKLAEHAHVSAESIRRSIRNGSFSVGLASALEVAVGRDYLKREDLCPKIGF